MHSIGLHRVLVSYYPRRLALENERVGVSTDKKNIFLHSLFPTLLEVGGGWRGSGCVGLVGDVVPPPPSCVILIWVFLFRKKAT